MIRRLSVFAIATLIGAPAFAAEPVTQPPGSVPAPALLPSAAASPMPAEVASTAPAKKQKIRCRTDYEIGSLVKRTRRCGDAATWSKADMAAREQTRRMQEELTGRYTGN